MKQTAKRRTAQVDKCPSAGPDGMALAPPAYGIESADSLSPQAAPIQRKAGESAGGGEAGSPPPNRTGLPGLLKAGVEALSGLSLDDVRVHYNSPKPTGLNALAYAQGTDIHVTPQQERHVPHEAWHVVQQKQGRVKATIQRMGIGINDDRALEQEADVMGKRAQTTLANPFSVSTETPRPPSIANSQPVQRIIQIGANPPYTVYKTRKGKATSDLVDRMWSKLRAASIKLEVGWVSALRAWAFDKNDTKTFVDEDALLEALKMNFPASSASQKRKKDIETQDTNILNLLSGVDEPKKKRARTISKNSKKAWDKFVSDLSNQTEFTNTSNELKKLSSGNMSTTSDVKTTLPAFFFSALGTSGDKMELDRMDFNFNNTEVLTHGFESPGQRDIAPKGSYITKKGKTKNFQPFNFNTVKIGNDIGTYAKHQNAPPTDLQNQHVTALNTLEKFRLPEQAFGTTLKRDFFTQGFFNTQEAFGQNHPHSNVEFLGATSGSGLTATQYSNMQEQQSLSNLNILMTAFTNFSNRQIGFDTKDDKVRTTPLEIMENLDSFLSTDKKIDLQERKRRKRKFRRSLKRAIISSENISGIDSDDEVSEEDLL